MTQTSKQSYRQKGVHKEAFYGRAKGRPITSDERDALVGSPLLLSLEDCRGDLATLFATPVQSIHMEIGFGAGEHLIMRARDNPHVGFIGAEPFQNGYAKCNFQALALGLKNVRIFPFDVRPLLDGMAAGSLNALYLLYPDPWRKRRHYKRRIFNARNLARFARLLKPGAPLYFASDWSNYTSWALAHVLQSDDFAWPASGMSDWQTPYDGWATTRYEQKAQREGRVPVYLTFMRR